MGGVILLEKEPAVDVAIGMFRGACLFRKKISIIWQEQLGSVREGVTDFSKEKRGGFGTKRDIFWERRVWQEGGGGFGGSRGWLQRENKEKSEVSKGNRVFRIWSGVLGIF